MKKLTFALVGAASLAIAACSSGSDDATNVDVNADNAAELNDLANAAANDAASEAETLANQQAQLNAENEAAAEPTDNLANQSEADAAVNGM